MGVADIYFSRLLCVLYPAITPDLGRDWGMCIINVLDVRRELGTALGWFSIYIVCGEGSNGYPLTVADYMVIWFEH